jgi:pyruvate-formate lyase-activating enzyme
MLSSGSASSSPVTGRAFQSICDVCLQEVPGHIERHDAEVFLVRDCQQHGARRFVTSRNGAAFERFDRAYHTLFPDDAPPHPPANSYFFITDACNLGCSYCLNEANSHSYFGEYDLDRFDADVRAWRGDRIGLAGGEPFSHPRFFEFARIVRAHGKQLRVCTNGLALADETVVRRLLDVSGNRCEVRMTFEGFGPECYAHLPVARVRERKLAALENLAKHRIATALCLTFDPARSRLPAQVRRATMRSVIDYAMTHDFVRALAFQSAVAVGGARDLPAGEVLSVDCMMDDIVAALPVAAERRHMYVAQKLMGLATALLRLPLCENSQFAMLFRVGDRWVGLDHFLDCDALDRRLDERLRTAPVTRARLLRALTTDVLATARLRRLPSLARLAWQVLPVFWRRFDLSRVPRSILPLASTTACDRYNYDASLARRCDKWGSSMVRGEVVHELLSTMTIRQLRERAAPPVAASGDPDARR